MQVLVGMEIHGSAKIEWRPGGGGSGRGGMTQVGEIPQDQLAMVSTSTHLLEGEVQVTDLVTLPVGIKEGLKIGMTTCNKKSLI
jgi:hypothetical protein